MSKAMQAFKDFLSVSPSVVFPDEVLELLEPVERENDKLEAENARLRVLVRNLLRVIPRDVSGVVVGVHGEHPTYYSFADAMRELEVEVE